jgi:hypothetical protein
MADRAETEAIWDKARRDIRQELADDYRLKIGALLESAGVVAVSYLKGQKITITPKQASDLRSALAALANPVPAEPTPETAQDGTLPVP